MSNGLIFYLSYSVRLVFFFRMYCYLISLVSGKIYCWRYRRYLKGMFDVMS